MGKPFTLSLSSLCLLLLSSACFAISSSKLNECQLNNLNALEPDHRVESEGGLIQTWNSQHPELKCAGVTVSKLTLNRNGLHLPSYSPYPRMIIIAQGKGALGVAIPGCPETFEEPQEQSNRRGSRSQKQQLQDSHQKIRHFNEGDVLVIPPGVPYWTYNTGDEPVVAISLLDTSNFNNQLDQTPRVFYLAGNPDIEYPETMQQQQQQKSHGGRKQGQHQQEEEEEGGSVLSGFSKHFLAQSFNTNEDIAEKLQSPDDERKQIVTVEGGLSVISPKWQEQQDEDEDEDEDDEDEQIPSHPPRQPSHGKREQDEDEDEDEDKPRPSRPSHGKREQDQDQDEDEDEDEDQPRKSREWRSKKTQPRRPRQEEPRERGCETRNGVEENICTLKLHENIARPSRADFYNPKAGRISTLNSLTLPALRQFQLSAQYVVLYKNGIYSPHWNLNANSVIYVTRGQGKVRVVNCQGNAVFDGELRRGQLLVVPQNFVVAEQAGEQGFEYIVFKTHHNAVTSYLKDVFRAIPSEVLAHSYNLRQSQVSELKYEGNWGPLVNPESQQGSPRVKVA
uniref:Glycinin A5A4B3 subunit n=1 Tax=Glycine soja TaxID=3848 RepID=A3KEY9_GLYSO|nr:glycinin A5A4B3 subunit [Glycine soja]